MQFIIEGVAGKNYKGDIGIDDINLQKGKCPRREYGSVWLAYDVMGSSAAVLASI